MRRIVALFAALIILTGGAVAKAEDGVCYMCMVKLYEIKTPLTSRIELDRSLYPSLCCRYDDMVDAYETVFSLLRKGDAEGAKLWYDALKDMAEYPALLKVLEQREQYCGQKLDDYILGRQMEAKGNRSKAISCYTVSGILDSEQRAASLQAEME